MTTAHEFKFSPDKTYASRANARTAVEKVFGSNHEHFGSADVRYFIAQDDAGRWFPVFVGERAVALGIHFKFSVVAC